MSNFKKISQHAISVLVGQWAVVGFAFVDSAIAGHIDPSALAALSIGIAIFLTVFIALLGSIQAFLPIAGQLFGAQRYTEIGYQARQSLYFAAWISVLGLFCLLFPKPLFIIANIDEQRQIMIQGYLNILTIGLIPAVYFRIYVALNQAISRPLFVTFLQIMALVIKVPLSWFFAIKLGMGISGCALSSGIIHWVVILIAIIALVKHPVYKPLELLKKLEPPCWKDQKSLMRLGIPIGISNFIEVAGSTFMALFTARFQSDLFSSAHQLMTQFSTIIFQIPLSIGIACSATVAQFIGARKMQQARDAGLCGIKMSIGFTALACFIVFFMRQPFLSLLTNNQEVLNLTISLTGFVIFYQLLDSAQITSAFILRAYKVAILPTILYAVTLWVIGLGGGYLIAFNHFGITPAIMQGPAGFWFTSALSLGICAVVLNFLVRYVTQKHITSNPTS